MSEFLQSNPLFNQGSPQPWQLMGHNSLRESQNDGTPPISNSYWGNRLWFMLMNGINFLKSEWGWLWSITEQKLHYRFILKTNSLWQEKCTLQAGLSSSLEICYVTIPKREQSFIFLLSSFSKDIWHFFIQREAGWGEREKREGGREKGKKEGRKKGKGRKGVSPLSKSLSLTFLAISWPVSSGDTLEIQLQGWRTPWVFPPSPECQCSLSKQSHLLHG